MPFSMKIQPIDFQTDEGSAPVKPVVKSRLKRLFERPFHSALRNSAAEKAGTVQEPHFSNNASSEFEPSSVCLRKMVQNFIEENNEKPQHGAGKCSRNCFSRNCSDSSEDESDFYSGFGDSNPPSSGQTLEILKSLVPCPTVAERNLLADTARIIEKNKICKGKDEFSKKVVTDGLLALGFDASICKSRWEKSPSYPAGEYEYIAVLIEGERLIIDIDFRSEFEIARPTKTYKTILQTLPYILVTKADRLQKIITVVCDAAAQSLKKKGMHLPPWRKSGYVIAKWLTPDPRASPEEKSRPESELEDPMFAFSGEEEEKEEIKEWKLPEIKPRSSSIGIKMVSGLASVIEDHHD